MKILVTGCNGFVGRHTIAAFRAAGHDVCGGDVAGTPPPDLPYLPFDATDSFASKALVADICAILGKPYVIGAIDAFSGQLLTVLPGRTACLRCVFPEAPPPAPPAGPLGGIPGVIGSLQAVEAIKHLTGIGRLHTDALLVYDGLTATFRSIKAARRPDCPCCARAVAPEARL